MDELTVKAKLEHMDAVQAFISVRLANAPPKLRNKISIAVDEIFSNIAVYAYGGGEGEVTVRVQADGGVVLEFEDCGTAYNPLAAEEPDVSLSAEEREIGGLGIFLVKNIMDSAEYRREGGKNILTVKKNL